MISGNKLGIVIIAVSLVFFSFVVFLNIENANLSKISDVVDTDMDDRADIYNKSDLVDYCQYLINSEQENFNPDDIGTVCNFDKDNDGIVDVIDAFDQNPEEWDDFDFDGIGANEDIDDDNDGILDVNDPLPSPISSQLTMKYIDLIENCTVMNPGQEQEFCYRNFFVSLIDKGELTTEIITMAHFYAKQNIIEGCHTIAHHIGHYSFIKNPNLNANILQGEPMCRNGFYHGILSAFFGYLKTEEIDISNSYEEVCDEFALTPHWIDCIHGLGHGFIVYYDDDLIAAVDACDGLTDSLSNTCKFGVMMAYNEHKLTETFDVTKDIPDICDVEELTNSDKTICYSKMGQILGFLTKHDIEKGYEYCTFVDPNFQEICNSAVLGEFKDNIKEKNSIVPFN